VYLPFLEQVYGLRIFVWAEQSSEKQSFVLLRSHRPITPTQPSKCVFIVQHWGGRMDRLTGKLYPQCELLGWMPLVDASSQEELSLLFRIPRVLRDITRDEQLPSLQPVAHLFRSQALFPTGSIMALRTKTLTLWVGEPSCTSLDIPPMEGDIVKSAIATVSSTRALRTELLALCQDIISNIDDTIYRFCTDHSKNRYVLIWRLSVAGIRVWTITQDIPRHGLQEILQQPRVIATDEPPHLILSSVLTGSTSLRPSPAMMMRHVGIMFMIRDVVFFRFLQWYHRDGKNIMPMVSMDEKIESFLRSNTMTRSEHYLRHDLPDALPTTYTGAERICVVQDRVVIPSDATRSRLFYFLQWKMVYDYRAMTDPSQMPQGDHQRPNAFTNSNQWYNRDPRVVTFALHDFMRILSTTTNTEPDTVPEWVDSLKHPAKTYITHTFPINQMMEFVEQACPQWRSDMVVTDIFRDAQSIQTHNSPAPYPLESLPYCFVYTPVRRWSLYRQDPSQTRGPPLLFVLPENGDVTERVSDAPGGQHCTMLVHPSFGLP